MKVRKASRDLILIPEDGDTVADLINAMHDPLFDKVDSRARLVPATGGRWAFVPPDYDASVRRG